ncbi:uncharacterized protein [Clytia hemisphaerica]|uniref:uncharacterized protein n=1 Tax=Clytia hemisphaerica TaxID=252671 RepID=UPI0034D7B4EF
MTNSVLRGKRYNKAVRALKIMHEALQRLKFEAFENWLEENKATVRLTEVFESSDFHMFLEKQNEQTMKSATTKAEKLFELFQIFEASINHGDLGPMAQFWQSFINMSQTLSLRKEISCANVLRALSICYLPPDQVIEQTINKGQKGPGGIIGFSTSENTVQRWILTSHIAAEISADLKESLDIETASSKLKDLNETMRSRDEEDIIKCIDMISARNNPFVQSRKLIGLSSGVVASDDITNDLLTAADVGEKQLKRFVAERIQSSKIKFHDVIKRNNLKTFSSIFKTTQHKVNDQIITIKADRNTFSRLVVIQSSRSIDLRVVLNFELCSVPLSLSEPNGTELLSRTTRSTYSIH